MTVKAPYIDQQQFPKPPPLIVIENMEDQKQVNDLQNEHNKVVARFMDDLYNSLHRGNLVRDARIENLNVAKLLAGTITSDQIYIGSSRFELDGVLTQMRIQDDMGVNMVTIGDFASGTDFGIQIRNAANSVVFQALSNAGVFMSGAIITSGTIGGSALANGAVDTDQIANDAVTGVKILNATITGAKISGGTITGANIVNSTITDSLINDVNGSKLATGSVSNAKIGSLSADKITLSGTLTCQSGGTAIDIEDSGLIHFSGGGDIVMDMSGSNMNFIVFRTSAGVEKGYIFLNTSDHFKFLGSSGSHVYIESQGSGHIRIYSDSAGAIEIGSSNTEQVQIVARVDSDIIPDADSTYDLGSSSLAWFESFVDTYSDVPFRNAFVITESDKVDSNEHRDHAIYFMKRTTHRKGKDFNWERVAKFDEHGILHVKGINIITDEWDDDLDSYFEGNYDNEGDIFLLTNAPDNEPHKKAGLKAIERRKRDKEGKQRKENSQ